MSEQPRSGAATELRRARLSAGLTQRELGRLAGVTQTTVSMYESGAREPSVSSFSRILAAAGFTLIVEQRSTPRTLPDTPRGALLRRHSHALERLAKRHGLRNLRVFGSTARGDDRVDSDVDLVVDIDPGSGLLSLAGFADDASELLGVRVDVVPYRGLKDRVRAEVDRDAILV